MGHEENLKTELERLKAERECQETQSLLDRSIIETYQGKVHELEERVRRMTSAASSSAASTVTALDRILLMEPIVKGVQEHRDEMPKTVRKALVAYEAVVAKRD